MEEIGPQVVSPVVIHQALPGRFRDSYPMSKKRGLPLHPSSFGHQSNNSSDNWDPKSWNWDSSRFVANRVSDSREGNENLQLKLGGGDGNGAGSGSSSSSGGGDNGGMNLVRPQPVPRPTKRVRAGSPGGVGNTNYPMCQVDDCEEDLSKAKDYHRRHKVCEVHSKASKTLVGKQMQRFCQQCSRFHPLSEFDEGKRSCRRRLAGHNRRRRKTQPEETTSPKLLVPGSHENNVTNNDIINLLAVLSCAQGNSEATNGKLSSIPSKDQLAQILTKINSLPLPEHLAAKLNASVPSLASSENQKPKNGNSSSSSPSTMDFLAVLSKTPEPSTKSSDSEKSKFPCVEQETSLNLPLQLFSPSPEDYRSVRNFPSDGNFLSSGSSNPSPMSSPPVMHNLFPMRTSRETVKDNTLVSNSEGEIGYVKSTVSNGCSTSLQLFGSSIRPTENGSNQSSPYRAGYTSSSGSDHSPSSLSSDSQDRTGRIIFKLFDKNPNHLPGSLRTQIHNWLSNSPSEMESYIKPGCVVLSVYLSMSSSGWNQLEENFLNYVKSLVKDMDVNFWGNGRFLVHTDRQMVSHKEGKIRLCKSWGAWSAPELISVSPLAVVAGQEISLRLRGRNLTAPGTMIHCTHAAEYNMKEVPLSSSQNTSDDEITLNDFKVNSAASSNLGRFFIEVENKSRMASFPVIIADDTICQELRFLEPEINGTTQECEIIKHFLNELGWLFQRKRNSFLFGSPDYRLSRFKFLLIFSVEHDFCALVKTLLDILLELNVGREGIAEESLKMLSEIHLLNRAVKRSCRDMAALLVGYSVADSTDNSEKFIFVANMAGPGGVTPLHLAASTSSSDDMVDVLTSDPREVGLRSWSSVLDANGLTPYAYALMRNNHSYNALVARKLADKENSQISVSIEQFQEEVDTDKNTITNQNPQLSKRQKSCSRCSVVAAKGYGRKFPGSKGLLQRPYIHSMLMVAAVCVCVCVFLRGGPRVGVGCASFAWENVNFGSM